MKSFAKLIGKLPLAGKLSLRPLIFSVYQSTTPTERERNYFWCMVVLVLFWLLHAIQVAMGVRALGFDSPAWVKVISGLYALVNVCVVLTQLYLVYRVTRCYLGSKYPRTKRSYGYHSDTEAIVMLVVTIIGQITFLSLYFWYA